MEKEGAAGREEGRAKPPSLSRFIGPYNRFTALSSRVSPDIIILTQGRPQKGSQPHFYGRALHEEDCRRGAVNSGEVLLRASEWHHQPRRPRRVDGGKEEEGVKFSSRIRHRTMDQPSKLAHIVIRVDKIHDAMKSTYCHCRKNLVTCSERSFIDGKRSCPFVCP